MRNDLGDRYNISNSSLLQNLNSYVKVIAPKHITILKSSCIIL